MRFRIKDMESGFRCVHYFASDDKVERVKFSLSLSLGIPSDSLLLVCDDVRLFHLDNCSLQQYEAADLSIIKAYRKRLRGELIKVRFVLDQSSYTVIMDSSSSGLDARERFHRHGGGLPPHRQNLFCLRAFIEDGDELRDFVTEDEPVIEVTEIPPASDRVINLTVSVENYSVYCKVEDRDTLFTLYGIVQRRIGTIPPDGDWVFELNGAALDHGSTFRALGIHDYSLLKLELLD